MGGNKFSKYVYVSSQLELTSNIKKNQEKDIIYDDIYIYIYDGREYPIQDR
jgi:hypothetical protein